MSPVRGVAKARAVLTAHGVDPDGDVKLLVAAIEARGWRVSVEQESTGDRSGRASRWHALATRATQPQAQPSGFRPHLRSSGPSARHVLIAVLAQALEREA